MKRVAILASYNGSGFEALYNAAKKSELSIEIPLIISNNSSAKVIEKAKNYGIDSFIVNSKTADNPDKKIEELLKEYQCEYLFLSGYMKNLA